MPYDAHFVARASPIPLAAPVMRAVFPGAKTALGLDGVEVDILERF